MEENLKVIEKCAVNVRDILRNNFGYSDADLVSERFMIIHDSGSPLAEVLTEAYKRCLTGARMISFYEFAPEEVIMEVEKCLPGDLVVLIESTSFRMSNFRWRLELFDRGLKVIEHAHIGANKAADQVENYVDTLANDGDYYRRVGKALTERLDKCLEVKLIGIDGAELIYKGGMEEAKKNIGDYLGMKNQGGGFPIGEVFSEAKDLEMVNGEVNIGAFADINHDVAFCEVPIKMKVEKGCMTLADKQIEGVEAEDIRKLQEILELVKTENPDQLIWMRELGLGMNRGISKNKRLTDVTAYERVCGPHVSLGLKHDVYRKKITDKVTRFHIDIFPDVERIEIEGEIVFQNGQYIV